MGFKCGIVGLPNVGKSTLFNALTRTAAAAAENYPFCTIEPNVGQVPVPDSRLQALAEISKSAKTVPTLLSFVDIAGLVRGAAKGEGLGNQFLGHIREVDAIIHVLRCFDDENVTHVDGRVDPVADAETIETELMLADLQSLERRRHGLEKRVRGQDKEAKVELHWVDTLLAHLQEGSPARVLQLNADDARTVKRLQLLTSKPVLYACNVDEADAAAGNTQTQAVQAMARQQGAEVVIVSAKIEAELAQLDDEAERADFLEALGLAETGLDRVIAAGYRLLGLQTYFTTGPKESRAWTFPVGINAQAAAGIIHSDFARGFIAAETAGFDDFVACAGEQGVRDAGKMRQEGRHYLVKDGDVILFRFNV